MLKFDSSRVGVTQGSLVLFSDFQDGGAMWTGDGARVLRRTILFSEKFQIAPAVQVALSMWDIDQQYNSRVDISAENVTEAGFEVVFRTWGDTRVARVRADWIAFGPLAHEDHWEVS